MSRSGKIRSALQILFGGHVVAGCIATYAGHQGWYDNVLMPAMQLLDAETTHWLAVKAAKYRLVPRNSYQDPKSLRCCVWNRQFSNPIGLAAGFDKHGEAIDGLLKIGFGFVEVGSVTPLPQDGNPKPRVFRLKEDQAVINRYGFNSDGHAVVRDRLLKRAKRRSSNAHCDDRNMLNENFWSPDKSTEVEYTGSVGGLVGINLGKNKISSDAVNDYVEGVEKFGAVADYLVINISSPNTPGLREMQGRQVLHNLIQKVAAERNKLPENCRPPLLVKIAPDLSEQDKSDIAAVVTSPQSGVDGLIISNTTIGRPDTLHSEHRTESGGLSGDPLSQLSTQVIADMYRLTQGRIPIVGVGGVSSGQDAFDKIKAGASLVQIYTALAYHGPPIVKRIKHELAEILQQEGYTSLSEAVGADWKNSHK